MNTLPEAETAWTRTKAPRSVLDYVPDWTLWLDAVNDLIESIEVEAIGIKVDSSFISANKKSAVIWVSGGTINMTGKVTVRIITVNGRVDERTMLFEIRAR